jgi:hypothetical protein
MAKKKKVAKKKKATKKKRAKKKKWLFFTMTSLNLHQQVTLTVFLFLKPDLTPLAWFPDTRWCCAMLAAKLL